MSLVKINNVEHLTAMIKAIVPRSFEKTFGNLSTNEVVAGFTFCVAGLSQTELNTGLAKIKQMGYCPDPAMFAKWCKGLDGFDNSNIIADSYIGKHGALGRLEKWLADPSQPISTAIKQAYDATYELWGNIYSDSDKTKAELAFKDEYQAIVNDLVNRGIACQDYQAPIGITINQPKQVHIPASDDFVNEIFAKLKGRAK